MAKNDYYLVKSREPQQWPQVVTYIKLPVVHKGTFSWFQQEAKLSTFCVADRKPCENLPRSDPWVDMPIRRQGSRASEERK